MKLDFLKPNKRKIFYTIVVYLIVFLGPELLFAPIQMIAGKCPEGAVRGFNWVGGSCMPFLEAILLQIIIPLIVIYVIVSWVRKK